MSQRDKVNTWPMGIFTVGKFSLEFHETPALRNHPHIQGVKENIDKLWCLSMCEPYMLARPWGQSDISKIETCVAVENLAIVESMGR